eukprot:CAMPEP_0170619260 /NCGR_PEP_ID=MMETSP0224-20130122/27423_1 /TAXON_ID=285029 /ORGANISM="Togula jolla, Strain CCCM 725" /LENGTH=438 /DNA_ID=CAMNT_0010945341 /DNA_START=212 /DNA_END=1528 /DNA_ORIENTATION=+
MTLENHEDVQYVGEMIIGQQRISGVIDTGSFELLVFSNECELCGDRELLYNHNCSSKYHQGNVDMMHSFGSGDTWSHEAFDTVKIGPLGTTNQSFWEVVDTAMPVLKSATFQAIVGLGPCGSAKLLADKRVTEALQVEQNIKDHGGEVPEDVSWDTQDAIRAQKHSNRKVDLATSLKLGTFSVCIGPWRGDPGYVVWNDDLPKTQSNYFVNVPNVGPIHWSVQMSDVRIGHGVYGGSNVVDIGCGGAEGPCGAVLDTGTSLLAAPKAAIDQVDKALEKIDYDCSRISELPDLLFKLGDSEFSLPPESYVGKVTGIIPTALREVLRSRSNSTVDTTSSETGCQSLLMEVDSKTQFGPMWILGLPFFRKYYTSFNSGYRPSSRESRSLSFAVADEHCKPTNSVSLIHAARRAHDVMHIDPSKLRMSTTMNNARKRRRYDL